MLACVHMRSVGVLFTIYGATLMLVCPVLVMEHALLPLVAGWSVFYLLHGLMEQCGDNDRDDDGGNKMK